MSDINIPSEDEPKRMELSQEDILAIMAPIDNSEREEAARITDLTHEAQALDQERRELITEIESGNDDPGLQERLQIMTNDLVTTQSEIIALQGRIGIEPEDNDIITE